VTQDLGAKIDVVSWALTFNPLANATPATEAPGCWQAATTLALNALEKRRRFDGVLAGIISFI
jgi:hypothetical protein